MAALRGDISFRYLKQFFLFMALSNNEVVNPKRFTVSFQENFTVDPYYKFK
jgi:hypothetical protein